MNDIPIPYDVYVVGTGMVGYRQLTREAEAALHRSDRVYLVHYQALVERYIEEELASRAFEYSCPCQPS